MWLHRSLKPVLMRIQNPHKIPLCSYRPAFSFSSCLNVLRSELRKVWRMCAFASKLSGIPDL